VIVIVIVILIYLDYEYEFEKFILCVKINLIIILDNTIIMNI